MNHSVTLTRDIQAPPEAVFRAFTTPSGLNDWCSSTADLDKGKGAYLHLWSETGYQLAGEVTEKQENSLVSWRFHSPFPGTIQVGLSQADGGTHLAFKLSGEESVERHLSFWTGALDNLKAVLETGLDRRVYDRPMLGILIGGLLDEDSREQYEVPISYGVIVNGTVQGMGAAKLGLVENDVLFEMNAVSLRDYRDLQAAISPFKAGDEVTIAWHRGAERHTGRLQLAGRPVPYTPASPAELADYIEGIYDRLDAELAEILDEVPEELASYRSMEKEWTVHEIIAHTIATERALQLWIAATLNGQILKEWASNDPAVVQSITTVYPTLPELVSELHRTEAQTIALLRNLPPEIVTHKGVYQNIVTESGEHGLPLHTRMHYDSIRTLIEEAREKSLLQRG